MSSLLASQIETFLLKTFAFSPNFRFDFTGVIQINCITTDIRMKNNVLGQNVIIL